MDYFCYISRNKVDQLFQSLSVNQSDEWTETESKERDMKAEIAANWSIANILQLFKSGISYGRKGVIQKERKVKVHYVEKLRQVLISIAREKPIQSLEEIIETSSKFESIYYHHEGVFRINEPLSDVSNPDSIVSLVNNTKSRTLILDCSLRFFSEGNDSEKFILHSGNMRFFKGDVNLLLETVFILLGEKDDVIIGTPLFLKLKAESAQDDKKLLIAI